jgi:hypothetical protein
MFTLAADLCHFVSSQTKTLKYGKEIAERKAKEQNYNKVITF